MFSKIFSQSSLFLIENYNAIERVKHKKMRKRMDLENILVEKKLRLYTLSKCIKYQPYNSFSHFFICFLLYFIILFLRKFIGGGGIQTLYPPPPICQCCDPFLYVIFITMQFYITLKLSSRLESRLTSFIHFRFFTPEILQGFSYGRR